jgi:hypothetical protein
LINGRGTDTADYEAWDGGESQKVTTQGRVGCWNWWCASRQRRTTILRRASKKALLLGASTRRQVGRSQPRRSMDENSDYLSCKAEAVDRPRGRGHPFTSESNGSARTPSDTPRAAGSWDLAANLAKRPPLTRILPWNFRYVKTSRWLRKTTGTWAPNR